MHFPSILLLTLSSISLPVLAQRGQHFGGGGGNRNPGSFTFTRGGNGFGGAPSTFITVASPPPAVATNAPAAQTSAAASSGGGSTGGSGGSGAVDASLIPPFGITAGIKANDGTGNCVGDGGKGIPCTCPPDINTFVKAVETQVAGGLAFPTGNSVANQLTRLTTCIISLQNFVGGPGSGVGCPAVSTTWKELQAQLQSEQ